MRSMLPLIMQQTCILIFCSAPDIQKYILDFQAKYKLAKYIQLNSKVISAAWDEHRGEYDVEIETPNGIVQDRCHVLISGAGVLNKWKCTQAPGTW